MTFQKLEFTAKCTHCNEPVRHQWEEGDYWECESCGLTWDDSGEPGVWLTTLYPVHYEKCTKTFACRMRNSHPGSCLPG